ncbi:hypothetical protein C8J57DRAFT_1462329 [Mycena rebaudengoi]|nr:hypothetical protein C8J57DRAFT_1462329 [Mycena rebaudengoi]
MKKKMKTTPTSCGGEPRLADGLGPNALGRFDRDVLAQPGVAYAMIFEGVNDIGVAATTPTAQQAIYVLVLLGIPLAVARVVVEREFRACRNMLSRDYREKSRSLLYSTIFSNK